MSVDARLRVGIRSVGVVLALAIAYLADAEHWARHEFFLGGVLVVAGLYGPTAAFDWLRGRREPASSNPNAAPDGAQGPATE